MEKKNDKNLKKIKNRANLWINDRLDDYQVIIMIDNQRNHALSLLQCLSMA